jgi:hypothetical protein
VLLTCYKKKGGAHKRVIKRMRYYGPHNLRARMQENTE